MVKVFVLFGLFYWWRVSWAIAMYLARRAFPARVARADLANHFRLRFGKVPSGMTQAGDFLFPMMLSLIMYFALLFLGANVAVQQFGLTL